MVYKLFLDDLRAPPDGTWVVARSVLAAQQHIMQHGLPLQISFDHDLGGDEDAPALMRWLIDGHLDEWWDAKSIAITVHSANPVGKQNLLGLWESFQRNTI